MKPGLHKAAHVMRTLRITILAFFALLMTSSHSQEARKDYKWPGFVQLNDSVFISLTEISISDYYEVCFLLKPTFGSNSQLGELLPNPITVDWYAYNSFNKYAFSIDSLFQIRPFYQITSRRKNKVPESSDTSFWFLNIIKDLPIVNVTKKQALYYCAIRGKAFSLLKQNVRRKKDWKLPDSVVFRLPTYQEWVSAFGVNFSIDSILRISESSVKGGVVSKELWEYQKNGEYIPLPVYNGYYNSVGIFNLCGNVSELLYDTDDAIGGSYAESIRYCSPDIKSKFGAPHSSIGFRVVAVIKK
jgi:hypothetical protein